MKKDRYINFIVSLLFLTIANQILCQTNSVKYYTIIDSIKATNAEILIEFQEGCFGCDVINGFDSDKCEETDYSYLLWASENKFHIQKFSNCQSYKSLELSVSNAIEFSLEKLEDIKSEEILPVTYLKKDESSKEIIKVEKSVTHYTYYKLRLITPKQDIVKVINHFNMNTEYIYKKHLNINFDINQNTSLNQIIKLIKQETY